MRKLLMRRFEILKRSLHFYLETSGCQMNVSDSEIVRGLLLTAGHQSTDFIDNADIILTNTCSIRENAENKIWARLQFFKSLKEKRGKKRQTIVGVLGVSSMN